jgi:hypothetical protein
VESAQKGARRQPEQDPSVKPASQMVQIIASQADDPQARPFPAVF